MGGLGGLGRSARRYGDVLLGVGALVMTILNVLLLGCCCFHEYSLHKEKTRHQGTDIVLQKKNLRSKTRKAQADINKRVYNYKFKSSRHNSESESKSTGN
uniref:Uncharacterized protein n=1 Tax=Lotharella globosa TaxID=91324 RepID=A0A7S3Z7H4_9EUKA